MDPEYSEEEERLFADYCKSHLKEYGDNYLKADDVGKSIWKRMVLIGMDLLGNTCCGYCGQRVDYDRAFRRGQTRGEKI